MPIMEAPPTIEPPALIRKYESNSLQGAEGRVITAYFEAVQKDFLGSETYNKGVELQPKITFLTRGTETEEPSLALIPNKVVETLGVFVDGGMGMIPLSVFEDL